MQYCSLQHWTLLLSPVPSTTGYIFLLWLHPFILSGVISPLISSSILGTYWPWEFLFQYPIILPSHIVHGVLKARILKWFAIPFSSGPHSVGLSGSCLPFLSPAMPLPPHSISTLGKHWTSLCLSNMLTCFLLHGFYVNSPHCL